MMCLLEKMHNLEVLESTFPISTSKPSGFKYKTNCNDTESDECERMRTLDWEARHTPGPSSVRKELAWSL